MDQVTQYTIILGVAGFLAKEIWAVFQKLHGKIEADKDENLKINTKAVQANTIAITKMNGRLESVEKAIAGIPKMKEDLNKLWSRQKVRQGTKGL